MEQSYTNICAIGNDYHVRIVSTGAASADPAQAGNSSISQNEKVVKANRTETARR